MRGAPDLRRSAMDASWIDRRGQYARDVSGHVMKSTNLDVTEMAPAVQKLTGLSGWKAGNMRGRLDIVEPQAGFLTVGLRWRLLG